MITEEECLRRISAATERLRDELRKAHEDTSDQKYRVKTLEWAMHGLMHHTGRVTITVNGPTGIKDSMLMEMVRQFAGNAAHRVLEESGIAFKQHAELYELKSHVHYLENHAASRGVQFRSWDEKQARFGDRPAEYGNIDRPLATTGSRT